MTSSYASSFVSCRRAPLTSRLFRVLELRQKFWLSPGAIAAVEPLWSKITPSMLTLVMVKPCTLSPTLTVCETPLISRRAVEPVTASSRRVVGVEDAVEPPVVGTEGVLPAAVVPVVLPVLPVPLVLLPVLPVLPVLPELVPPDVPLLVDVDVDVCGTATIDDPEDEPLDPDVADVAATASAANGVNGSREGSASVAALIGAGLAAPEGAGVLLWVVRGSGRDADDVDVVLPPPVSAGSRTKKTSASSARAAAAASARTFGSRDRGAASAAC